MVDIKKYVEPPAEFLTPQFVKENPTLVWEITGEGSFVESKEYETTQLVIPLVCGEHKRLWGVNKTNARIIEDQMHMSNTKYWVGKMVQFEVIKLQTGKDSILVKNIH